MVSTLLRSIEESYIYCSFKIYRSESTYVRIAVPTAIKSADPNCLVSKIQESECATHRLVRQSSGSAFFPRDPTATQFQVSSWFICVSMSDCVTSEVRVQRIIFMGFRVPGSKTVGRAS